MNGRNRKRLNRVLAMVAMAAMIPAAGWAATGPDGRRSKTPPQEAFTACEGKKAGDTVAFANRRGEKVEGICREVDGRLVAMRGEGSGRAWKGHAGRGGKQQPRLERLAATLELTEAQQEQAKAILATEQEKVAPLWEKKRANKEQIRTAIHSAQADEQTLRTLAAAQAEIQAELLVARAATWKQINALLTPEQQERAQKMKGAGAGKPGYGSCR